MLAIVDHTPQEQVFDLYTHLRDSHRGTAVRILQREAVRNAIVNKNYSRSN